MKNKPLYTLTIKGTNKWSGVKSYRDTTMAFTPSISKKTKRLNLGLTPEQIASYEKTLGLSKGALTDQLNLSDGSLKSEYWVNFKLEIPEKGVLLDTNQDEQEMIVQVLKASGLVCSRGEISATATLELHNEEEKAQKDNRRLQGKTDAFIAFGKMSEEDRLDYLISQGRIVDTVTPSVIIDLVGRDVENNSLEFLNRIKSDNYKSRIKLFKYVSNNIIKQKGNLFLYGDTLLGASADLAIEFLKRPANNEIAGAVASTYTDLMKEKSQPKLPLQEDTDKLIKELQD